MKRKQMDEKSQPAVLWGSDKTAELKQITYGRSWYRGSATKEPQELGHSGVGGGKSGIVIQGMDTLQKAADFIRAYGHWPYCKVIYQRMQEMHYDGGAMYAHGVEETVYERDIPPAEWERRYGKDAPVKKNEQVAAAAEKKAKKEEEKSVKRRKLDVKKIKKIQEENKELRAELAAVRKRGVWWVVCDQGDGSELDFSPFASHPLAWHEYASQCKELAEGHTMYLLHPPVCSWSEEDELGVFKCEQWSKDESGEEFGVECPVCSCAECLEDVEEE